MLRHKVVHILCGFQCCDTKLCTYCADFQCCDTKLCTYCADFNVATQNCAQIVQISMLRHKIVQIAMLQQEIVHELCRFQCCNTKLCTNCADFNVATRNWYKLCRFQCCNTKLCTNCADFNVATWNCAQIVQISMPGVISQCSLEWDGGFDKHKDSWKYGFKQSQYSVSSKAVIYSIEFYLQCTSWKKKTKGPKSFEWS